MTCKDCLYYEACVNHYTQGQLTMINGDCSTFTDRSEWLHLPCKVGDKIYMLVTRKTHCFVFEEGKKMLRVDNQHTFIKETYLTKLNFFKVINDFGKTVFLAKDEAEKALKEKK